MNVKPCQIDVDEETAALLEARAGARGMTVSELLADIACNQEVLPADLAEMRKGRTAVVVGGPGGRRATTG